MGNTQNSGAGAARPSCAYLPNGVLEGRTQDGRRCFVLPPVPKGSGQQPAVVLDYIQNWEELKNLGDQPLPGGGRDATFLLGQAFRDNASLGLMKDWKELWGREEGKRCLLVCPGPSLTESLPELAIEAAKDDTFTMGLNRSHRVMDLDYFMAIDRIGQPDWITRDTGETILLAATIAAHHVCREFNVRYWGEVHLEGFSAGLTPMMTGLCITLCDAMHAAYRLGATTIELHGCDFALSGHVAIDPAGKSYYHLDKYYVDQRSHVGTDCRRSAFPQSWPVVGIDGRVVFVNYEMMANASYTVAMCAMLSYVGVRVVNKSKTGILFWGVE